MSRQLRQQVEVSHLEGSRAAAKKLIWRQALVDPDVDRVSRVAGLDVEASWAQARTDVGEPAAGRQISYLALNPVLWADRSRGQLLGLTDSQLDEACALDENLAAPDGAAVAHGSTLTLFWVPAASLSWEQSRVYNALRADGVEPATALATALAVTALVALSG